MALLCLDAVCSVPCSHISCCSAATSRSHLGSPDHCLPSADFRHGTFKPRVVPFRLGLQEAQAAFESWQRGHWLAPNKVLGEGTSAVRPVLLPFWLFEATVQVQYAGVRREILV